MKHPARNLSFPSEHRLHAYTAAATAAGVGALCLAPVAEAKIVYNPVNVKIVQNVGLILFDLNHDGIADFGLSNSHVSTSSTNAGFLKVVPMRAANEIWGLTKYPCSNCAAALPKGTKVGPKGQFRPDYPLGEIMCEDNHVTYACAWPGVTQAYLGLKFVIKGKTHFGWARVKVSVNFGTRAITATLTGYAYETIPDKPIIAGATTGLDEQAGSLGALAAGAVGP